ncbi:hypothetical protein [Aeromicrobium wangtongii]|uniref:SAF domain-containing protein n=1 Tax=Aeromicrobium wangtongii TaxID=2969247 RepID=A0ABY5MAV8_9ACTN|nr:hypothetical protein [Aeromicrobium wangtongii]MCD9197082.1 hypothetical protein [Aeromicrobium wangtongii]UUP14582.1 hypothetical protein NQV15_04520 [Aeromicrobium wangtongii]
MTNWRRPRGQGRAAPRLRLRPWRDPRLVLGVLLVLGATVLGARLAAAGDDRVEYWSVRADVVPGDTITQDDLRPARVRLTREAADDYVRTTEQFSAPLDDLVWAQPLTQGSLVAKTSLVPRSSAARGQLPLNVALGAAPADLARGDLVDVWVGPGPGDEPGPDAVRVLGAVRVLHSGNDVGAQSGSLAQTVLVDVDDSRLAPDVISTVSAGHVTLVRVGS